MLTARSTKWYIVNDPYGKADRMNEVNKEMVNELFFDIFGHLPDCICNHSPECRGGGALHIFARLTPEYIYCRINPPAKM